MLCDGISSQSIFRHIRIVYSLWVIFRIACGAIVIAILMIHTDSYVRLVYHIADSVQCSLHANSTLTPGNLNPEKVLGNATSKFKWFIQASVSWMKKRNNFDGKVFFLNQFPLIFSKSYWNVQWINRSDPVIKLYSFWQ